MGIFEFYLLAAHTLLLHHQLIRHFFDLYSYNLCLILCLHFFISPHLFIFLICSPTIYFLCAIITFHLTSSPPSLFSLPPGIDITLPYDPTSSAPDSLNPATLYKALMEAGVTAPKGISINTNISAFLGFMTIEDVRT